jgi:hypothetical protein
VQPLATDQPTHRWFPDGLPDHLLDADERTLLRALGCPTLIRVPGAGTEPPRAISTLLHGDESTGLQAVHHVLRRRRSYPFDLYVVIGNVQAALATPGFAFRHLDDQEDMNRIWGLNDPTTAQRQAADAILARLIAAAPESLADLHNNTGDNPFYAIVTQDRAEVYNLATLFTTTLLRWDLLVNTLMEALHGTCPSIAVECGLPGRPESFAFALDGVRRYLGAPPLRTDAIVRDHDRLGELRKVTVAPGVRFRFGGDLDDELDLVLAADGDVHNFDEVPAGHVLGRVRPGSPVPVRVHDRAGRDLTDDYLAVIDDELVLTERSTPVMMTRTVAAARQDCLFYLASELPPPEL